MDKVLIYRRRETERETEKERERERNKIIHGMWRQHGENGCITAGGAESVACARERVWAKSEANMIVFHLGLPLCSAIIGMACTPCCVNYALQVCVCSRKWCGTQNLLTHRPLLVVPNQAQHPQDTAGAEVASTKKGLGRTNAIRPGESGAAAAAASALAPIGPSEVSSEEATVPDDGSLGGGGGRGRGGDGGSGFDDVLGEGGGGGKFDDLMEILD